MSNPEALRRRGRCLPVAAPRTHERAAWSRGQHHVAGVDEAGRGALAGPVVAAAAIMPADHDLPHVTDSKLLSPRDREALFAEITATALAWAVGFVGPAEIDQLNILQATYTAMRRALRQLAVAPDLVLVDGWPLPDCPFPQQNVIGGDRECYAIAAASIIAKVTRDRLMIELDATYPAYGFAGHKGYSAPAHLRALAAHGPCPIHRLSFAPCRVGEQRSLFETE